MHNTYLAIGAAALAAWIFGAIYYGVLGKTWQRAQGLDPEQCKGQKMPLAPMVVSLACEILMAIFLADLLIALKVSRLQGAAMAGLLVGIAFMSTTTLVNNMFQQRKLMLSVIDSVHWVGVAIIECVTIMLLI